MPAHPKTRVSPSVTILEMLKRVISVKTDVLVVMMMSLFPPLVNPIVKVKEDFGVPHATGFAQVAFR